MGINRLLIDDRNSGDGKSGFQCTKYAKSLKHGKIEQKLL